MQGVTGAEVLVAAAAAGVTHTIDACVCAAQTCVCVRARATHGRAWGAAMQALARRHNGGQRRATNKVCTNNGIISRSARAGAGTREAPARKVWTTIVWRHASHNRVSPRVLCRVVVLVAAHTSGPLHARSPRCH